MVDFSHKYTKMPEGWESSILLEVFRSDSRELSHEFEMYDTHIEGGGHYKLPVGPVLVLLLQTKENEELWTTIRRCTPSKYYWYRGLRGYILPMRMTFNNPGAAQQRNLKALWENGQPKQQPLTEQQAQMDEIDDKRTEAMLDNSYRWKYPPAGLPTRKPEQ